MYRDALEKLYRWKKSTAKKPLVIRGARQTGKTWLMKEFGKNAYEQTIYINCDSNTLVKELFAHSLHPSDIITGLEIYTGKKIDPETTLIILDEIQEIPLALSSLKYFCEEAPEYDVICAGSLLGVALHQETSFPVGKVNFLDLYPLSFEEFVRAVAGDSYADLLHGGNPEAIAPFKTRFIELLKSYYFVGGMPEAVLAYSLNKDLSEVRQIQTQILAGYEQDFSKHAPPAVVPRIRMLWESIPAQLAKENKKFIYGIVREGARAKDYEMALLWLKDCGLIYQVNRASAPRIPLKAYEDLRSFKLFLLDIGLLSCMVSLDPKTLLSGSSLFVEFKGALTEQYVLQQLRTLEDTAVYYWTNDRGTAEIDFLIGRGQKILPLEVKAEVNLQAKSLKMFAGKFSPERSLRISMADYRDEGWLVNIPLYFIKGIDKLLSS